MSCHELNEQNEEGDDEVDEYEEENEPSGYVVKSFCSLQISISRIEKTKTVNLGD